MGLAVLNPKSAYARPTCPIIEQARMLVFNNPTPLLVDDNVDLKKI